MEPKKLINILIALSLALSPFVLAAHPAAAAAVYTCLPSCETNDGRMFDIAGPGLSTLVGITLDLTIAAPADATSLEIGIFDGDTSGIWDYGSQELLYTLYSDPEATGDSTNQVGQWSSNSMPDNAWYTIPVALLPAARSASGNYFYHLEVKAQAATATFANLFKVRTDGVIELLPQPFAYLASLYNANSIIYPNYPARTPTTYDGTFDFYTFVPAAHTHFVLWDGDDDYGSSNGSTKDTDDPNTPNNVLPAWATPSTHFEGVATGGKAPKNKNKGGAISPGSLRGFGKKGKLKPTGQPPDDNLANLDTLRSPSVTYTVIAPDGQQFLNNNPSGNMEWEMFSISSDPAEGADYTVNAPLTPGLYHIHMTGMDMNNLNAWRFSYNILGVCGADPFTGTVKPCKESLEPKMIGDTVFLDSNKNGVQDPGEPGIPGVTVQLEDGAGAPVLDVNGNPITRVTDANGKYFIDVHPRTVDPYTGEVLVDGVYRVEVLDTNFYGGGKLDGYINTTGGNFLTNTVTTENILTYDFGYYHDNNPSAPTAP